MKKSKIIDLTKPFQCRQGDVLLSPVSKIPSDLKKTKKVTLALGEASGHNHSIYSGAIGFADDESALSEFIEVKENNVKIEHQEHEAIELPVGRYEKAYQVNYTPEAIQRVVD